MATTSRKLPGVGLTGGWSTGENGWGTGANENWLALSVISQAVALDIVTTLPTSPSQGDIYLLSSAATADATYIAAYDNSQWVYFSPGNGWLFYVVSQSAYYKFDGSNWIEYESGSGGNGSGYTLPVASSATLGGVKVGNGLSITADGTLNVTGSGGNGSGYTLPPATTSSLGGVKVGAGLSVDSSGTVSWAASMTGYLSSYVFSIPTDTDRTLSSTAFNVKGTVLTVGNQNYTVKGAGFIIDTIAGHTYQLSIVTLNTDHSVDSVIGTASMTATETATETGVTLILGSSIELNAGTSYGFLLCDTSQSSGATELAMYGSGITNTTMTYFGLTIASPWRAAVTAVTAGLSMDSSNPWGQGGYFLGVLGAQSSIIQSSVEESAIAALDSKYVQQYSDSGTRAITLMTLYSSGNVAVYAGGKWNQVQVAGDYATNTALNNSVSTLSQSLANKFNSAGGTISGPSNIQYGTMNAVFQSDGNFVLYSGSTPTFQVSADAIVWNNHDFVFADDMPIATTDLVQHFTVTGVSSGATVTFPVAFSGTPVVLAQNLGTGDANAHSASPTSTGFTLHINLGGSSDISVIAIGPR